MNFLTKGVARGVSGLCGRALRRAAVFAALSSPMFGCAVENDGAAIEAEEVADIDSTSQALPILRTELTARAFGCPRSNQRVALLSVNGGWYVTAEQNSVGGMRCNRQTLGDWETFAVNELTYSDGTRRVALQSNRGIGNYVSATNGGGSTIYANRSGFGDWESFAVTQLVYPGIDGFFVALQTINGSYVTREGNGGPGCSLYANRPSIGEWEKFRVVCK